MVGEQLCDVEPESVAVRCRFALIETVVNPTAADWGKVSCVNSA